MWYDSGLIWGCGYELLIQWLAHSSFRQPGQSSRQQPHSKGHGVHCEPLWLFSSTWDVTCIVLGTYVQQIPDCHWPTGMWQSRKDSVSKRVKSPMPLIPLEVISNEQLEGGAEGRTQRPFTIMKAQSQTVQGVPVGLMTVAGFLILFTIEKGPDRKKAIGRWPNEELIYPTVLFCPWTAFHKVGKAELQHIGVYAQVLRLFSPHQPLAGVSNEGEWISIDDELNHSKETLPRPRLCLCLGKKLRGRRQYLRRACHLTKPRSFLQTTWRKHLTATTWCNRPLG